MKTLLKNPRSSAITSFILALPFVMIFLLILLNLEPNFGPLEPYLRSKVDQPNVLGSAIVLSAFLLLLAAFAINLVTIVQNVRAGNSITAYPINLLLAIIIFGLIIWVVGSIIIDQYPCWIGVPNCD